MTLQGRFFEKKMSFSHWLAARIGKCGPTVCGKVSCLSPWLFAFTYKPLSGFFNGLPLSHMHLDARSQHLIGLQSQQVFFSKQPLDLKNGLPGGRSTVPSSRVQIYVSVCVFYLGCPLSEGGFGQSHLEVLGCFGVSDSLVFLACTCDAS